MFAPTKPVSCPLFLVWVAQKVNENPGIWVKGGVAFDAAGNPVRALSKEACTWSFHGFMMRHLPTPMHAQMNGLFRMLEISISSFEEPLPNAREFIRKLLVTAYRMHYTLSSEGIDPFWRAKQVRGLSERPRFRGI